MFELLLIIIVFIFYCKKKNKKAVDILSDVGKKLNTVSSSNNNDKRYSTINSHYSSETLRGTPPSSVNTSLEEVTKGVKDFVKVDMIPAESVIRDDEHNWLAYQLREERRAARRTRAMFDHDLSHVFASECDADEIDDGLGD